MKKILFIISTLIITAACTTPRSYDDAVRIKPEAMHKYNRHPINGKIRSGSTLRGEVKSIEFTVYPEKCPVEKETKWYGKGFVLFRDSIADDEKQIERIPLEDLVLIGPKLNIDKNGCGNINFFETYNNPLLPKEVREVKVDSIFVDTCTFPCPCQKVEAVIPCIFCFDYKCPDRLLSWFFAEFKAGYSVYNDKKIDRTVGKDDWSGELALGLRLSKSKRWGLGLLFSTGIKLNNSFDSSEAQRPQIYLYGRYDLLRNTVPGTQADSLKELEDIVFYDTTYAKTNDGCRDTLIIKKMVKTNEINKLKIEPVEKRPCLNPFIYGIFGTAVDDATLDVYRLSVNTNCKNKINSDAPGIDMTLPLSFGVGIGLEYPLSKYLDLSVDFGFRSLAYGDKVNSQGYIVPTYKRVNTFIFRLGLTF